MTVKAFSAADICRIIKASKGTHVHSIECGELKIKFVEEPSKEEPQQKIKETQSGQIEETPKDILGEPIPTTELEELVEELDQENRMITDPAAYEQDLMDETVFSPDPGDLNGRDLEARRS